MRVSIGEILNFYLLHALVPYNWFCMDIWRIVEFGLSIWMIHAFVLQ